MIERGGAIRLREFEREVLDPEGAFDFQFPMGRLDVEMVGDVLMEILKQLAESLEKGDDKVVAELTGKAIEERDVPSGLLELVR